MYMPKRHKSMPDATIRTYGRKGVICIQSRLFDRWFGSWVFISDDCSYHYAHISGKSVISICSRHLVILEKLSNPIFSEKPIFHHTCATCSELPSYISIIDMDGPDINAFGYPVFVNIFYFLVMKNTVSKVTLCDTVPLNLIYVRTGMRWISECLCDTRRGSRWWCWPACSSRSDPPWSRDDGSL